MDIEREMAMSHLYDIDGEQAIEQAAVLIERLRIFNPLNGDGSNWMLDNVIRVLDQMAGNDRPSTEAKWERARLDDERDADYCRLHNIPAPRQTRIERLMRDHYTVEVSDE